MCGIGSIARTRPLFAPQVKWSTQRQVGVSDEHPTKCDDQRLSNARLVTKHSCQPTQVLVAQIYTYAVLKTHIPPTATTPAHTLGFSDKHHLTYRSWMRRPTALKCLLGLTAFLSAYTIINTANLYIRCIAYTYKTCCHHLTVPGSAQRQAVIVFLRKTHLPTSNAKHGNQALAGLQRILPACTIINSANL